MSKEQDKLIMFITHYLVTVRILIHLLIISKPSLSRLRSKTKKCGKCNFNNRQRRLFNLLFNPIFKIKVGNASPSFNVFISFTFKIFLMRWMMSSKTIKNRAILSEKCRVWISFSPNLKTQSKRTFRINSPLSSTTNNNLNSGCLFKWLSFH